MSVKFPFIRSYLLSSLKGSSDLYDHLLQDLAEEELDFRPNPDRFTIREIMAHLADWEDLFLQRMSQTRDEDQPSIQDLDEGLRATELNYALTNIVEQTAYFRNRREKTVTFLQALSPNDWQRTCLRSKFGPLTLESQAVLVSLHDNYHLQQIRQWRQDFANSPNLAA